MFKLESQPLTGWLFLRSSTTVTFPLSAALVILAAEGFTMAQDISREKLILDRGYNAVRQMAKEMVANGATLADILFHANQVWHEFKVAALAVPGVLETGAYIHQYDAQATNKIISDDPNYSTVEKMNDPRQNPPLPKSERTKFMEAQKKGAKAGK